MSIMYFAKLSMSSEIYKFYEDTKLFQKYLNKVYVSINNTRQIKDKYENIYKFNSLIMNDNKEIVGRFSKIFKGKVESYDWKNDKPISRDAKNLSSSINFYFDLSSQLIAYTSSKDFGFRAFTIMFKKYIEDALEDENIKVAVEMLIDEDDLKEKIEKLKILEEITFSIIPPNPPNKREFEDLFGDRAKPIFESNATQYTETYAVKSKGNEQGIKIVKYFYNIIGSIKNGYGSVIAKGKNYSNINETITSQEDAPKKLVINTKDKDSLLYIEEQGKKSIERILVEKNTNNNKG